MAAVFPVVSKALRLAWRKNFKIFCPPGNNRRTRCVTEGKEDDVLPPLNKRQELFS